jgi:hypothetical protein
MDDVLAHRRYVRVRIANPAPGVLLFPANRLLDRASVRN